jgi:hypothetical protein
MAWLFCCELAGTFIQCTNAIPKLQARRYKKPKMALELAAKKTGCRSTNDCGLSFGAQIAKTCLYLHSSAVLQWDCRAV